MCNCGKAAEPTQEFVVSTTTGEKVFNSKPEAEIYASLHNGKVVTRKK